MKNICCLIVLFLSVIQSLSQSKAEIESYLVTYIESFPQNQGSVYHEKNKVSISNNTFTYSNVLSDWGLIVSCRFDLSKVNNIVLDEISMNGKNLEYKVFFTPGYKCEKMVYSAVEDKTETTYENYALIIVSGNAKSDDVHLKIKGWLKKLALLNGAKML